MGLHQQFLWSGLQAVEKYLKAILLFNGKKAKNGGHDLEALFNEAKEIDYLNFSIEKCNQRFLTYLSKQGENRYLSIDAYNTTSAIHDLDNLVWDIRRYCQYTQNHLIERVSGNRSMAFMVRCACEKNYSKKVLIEVRNMRPTYSSPSLCCA